MNTSCVVDIMTVSLTINWCVLCFNTVPRLRRLIVKSDKLRTYTRIVNVCHHYADKPLLLAKIVTEQILIWGLFLVSIAAICSTTIIKHPFVVETPGNWQAILVQTLFGINIGRYMFTIIHKLFFRKIIKKVRFRADLMHHLVALTCYSLFLAYQQNMLLGLVGIVIESTSIFDEAGRYFKDQEREHTRSYKRLVVLGCAWTVCCRGVIPITFLVIAMFQQTPFIMDYAPLTVFFLSIIFFSVINVWQMLSNMQRLFKYTYEKSHELHQIPHTIETDTCSRNGRLRRLQLSKNNLGYLKPYDNKNIATLFDDEKQNMNNRKEFVKDTLQLQVNPGEYFASAATTTKKISNENETNCVDINSGLDVNVIAEDVDNDLNERRIHNRFDNFTSGSLTDNGNTAIVENARPTVEHYRGSNGSNNSASSDTVLIRNTHLNNSTSIQIMYSRSEVRRSHIRSHSMDNFSPSELCRVLTSDAGVSL